MPTLKEQYGHLISPDQGRSPTLKEQYGHLVGSGEAPKPVQGPPPPISPFEKAMQTIATGKRGQGLSELFDLTPLRLKPEEEFDPRTPQAVEIGQNFGKQLLRGPFEIAAQLSHGPEIPDAISGFARMFPEGFRAATQAAGVLSPPPDKTLPPTNDLNERARRITEARRQGTTPETQLAAQKELKQSPGTVGFPLLVAFGGARGLAKRTKVSPAEVKSVPKTEISPETPPITSPATTPEIRPKLEAAKKQGALGKEKTPQPEQFKVGQQVVVQLPRHKKPQFTKVESLVTDESGKVLKVQVNVGGKTEVLDPSQIQLPARTVAIRERNKAFEGLEKDERSTLKSGAKEFDKNLNDNALLFAEEAELQGFLKGINPRSPREQAVANSEIPKFLRERAEQTLGIKGLSNPVTRGKALRDLKRYVSDPKTRDFVPPEPAPLGDEVVPFSPASPGKSSSRSSQVFTKSLEPVKAPKGPVGRQDVVQHFRQEFKLPIRVGKFHAKQRRALGVFKVKEEVVRTAEANDLNTISHEVGHFIEKKVYGGIGRKSTLKPGKEINAELLKIGKDLYGKRQPVGGYRSEGFAEYMNYWLTTNDAARIAPKFTKFFEQNFLKANPEIARTLQNGRTLITKWREQGAVERVYANIDSQGRGVKAPIRERMGQGLRRIGTLFLDDIIPLEFAEKQLRSVKRIDPLSIDPAKSPTQIARAETKTATAKAKSMLLHGTFDYAGNKTGISLREALKPVSGKMKEFTSYAYAKRSLELHKRGINPGIDVADARHVVQKLESPAFQKAFQETVQFQDRVMKYAVDSGAMSKETAKVIRDLNQAYIPLKRVIEGKEGLRGAGKKLADIQSPVKRIKGSGRQIQDPFRSMIQNTAEMISIADRVRVGKALVDLAESVDGGGKWVERVPPPMKSTRFKIEDIRSALEDAGIELAQNKVYEEIATVYGTAVKYSGKENIVTFVRDGQRLFYEIDPQLYKTLVNMEQPMLNPYVDFFFGRPARAIRLGATGLQAGFGLITNPLRDAFTFMLQSEHTKGPGFRIVRAVTKKVFKPNNKMNRLFQRSGSDMSQFLGLDKRQMKTAIDDVLASDVKRKALNVVKHPIEVAKEIFSITEAGPRLAEFEAAYRKGEQLYGKNSASARIMAANSAAEVTVNFRRMGIYMGVINQITPFINAGVQGVAKFSRFASTHPRVTFTKAVAYLTIPTVALWMENKDKQWYKEMPEWLKYGFWHFEVGENKDGTPKIIRIPRPFEWGVVFATGPEMGLNYFEHKDPAIVKDGLQYIVEQSQPVSFDNIPPTLKIPIELYSNYDFFRERPIDPFFEVKYEDPEDRFSPYTTETAKFIGKQLGLSPRKIQHLISSSTGGLGTDLIRTGEKAAGLRKEDDLPSNLPVVGRLFTRTETPQKRARRLEFAQKEELGRINRKILKGNFAEAKEALRLWNSKFPDFQMPTFALVKGKAIKNQIASIRRSKNLSVQEKREKLSQLMSLHTGVTSTASP